MVTDDYAYPSSRFRSNECCNVDSADTDVPGLFTPLDPQIIRIREHQALLKT